MSKTAAKKVVALHAKVDARHAGLLPWEDGAAFANLKADFWSTYRPEGPAEDSLIDRMVWVEWRRRRLLAAEAAVHVAHAFDRSDDANAKTRTLTRVGVTDYTIRNEISIAEILRGSDDDDVETVEAIRKGIGDVERTLALIDACNPLPACLEVLDSDAQDWWAEAVEETDDKGAKKYEPTPEGLAVFLRSDALVWRKSWLAVNENRTAIRAQAIAESLDPARVRQLWEMEARLDRQFEKAVEMLVRLRELRHGAAKPA